MEPLIPSHTPAMTRVLQEALQGQPDLADESDASNRGRNAAFELVIAGHLARAGLPVLLQMSSDVQTDFGGAPMLIECKRPFSEASVGRNLIDGAKQLRKGRKTFGDDRTYCIVALSLSRLFNTGNQMPMFRTVQDMDDQLTGQLEQFANKNDHLLRTVERYGVSAAWFHLGLPILITEQPGFIFRETAIITPVAATTTDARALSMFAKQIKLR